MIELLAMMCGGAVAMVFAIAAIARSEAAEVAATHPTSRTKVDAAAALPALASSVSLDSRCRCATACGPAASDPPAPEVTGMHRMPATIGRMQRAALPA